MGDEGTGYIYSDKNFRVIDHRGGWYLVFMYGTYGTF